MDLSLIKKRLETLNKQTTSKEDKKNIFWKPSIGKQSVRVVPFKHNPSNPFTEMLFYYGIGNKVMASPSNWGEKDPIIEFAKQLRKTNDKENWRLAKKLDPKVRIFLPVVVKGEEQEGVKLWQFGKELYQEFLNMAADEEIGDFTDVMEGRDIKLNTVGPESTGTPYNKTSISPSLKSSPVHTDSKLVEKLLDEQPNPKDTFKKFTYDEVKQALQSWLSPEEDEEEEIEENIPFIPSTPVKKNNVDKFDDLFNEE
jgi:hypothetical protein